MPRRRLAVLLCPALLLAAAPLLQCRPADSSGAVSEDWVRQRALAYLEYATSVQSDSMLNAIAHMERDRVDPDYTAPVGVIDVGSFAGSFDQIEDYQDTRDFDGLYLVNMVMGYEGHPYVTPAMWARIKAGLLEFKYWYTDATPPVPDPDDPTRDWDNSFYWTENHQAIYHTIEYLAGQHWPTECFTQARFTPTGTCDGVDAQGRPYEMTGAQHRDRARAKLLTWLDERWKLGFAEWHSNIYYQKDATPLLSLVEFADDEELRTRAAMVLDVLLLDMATNSYKDVFGVTHGRSAMKDKRRGPLNDTWGIIHLLFREQQVLGFASTGDAGATLFARAKRYRMPQAVLEAARSDGPFVDRERHSVWIDESAPLSPDPAYPPGHPYTDTEENFTFWWGLGAWTVWQVVPLTLLNGDRYNLWGTELLAPFLDLRLLLGPLDQPPDLQGGRFLAQQIWAAAAVGLLKEANTYTYRRPEYMLSTVQDYRKGANAGQVHAWQATLGTDALVFTTHPMNPQQLPHEWVNADEGEPGYWTGTASMPRSAQYENVGIHLYSPAYPDGGLFGFFDFQAETHAYFPQDAFDQVVQVGNWTFGALGEAYIGLYSWRPTVWRDVPEAEKDLLTPRLERPFDLVAPGGPDDVWIVEMGTEEQWSSFGDFVRAVSNASVTVTTTPSFLFPLPDVVYESPSQGTVHFGWNTPLSVNGVEIPIHDYPRMSNPWTHVERGAQSMLISGEDTTAVLDWAAGTRSLSRVGEEPDD